MNTNPQKEKPQLAERLRNVRVGVRQDLEVSRHVFRGEVAYVLRDPVTFQTHRFQPQSYRVLASIHADRTLGDIFEELKQRELFDETDEERFYEFVFSLHRLSFLSLPVSDEKLLYRRHQARQAALRKRRLFSFLFFQIPLVNPDAFLTRTMDAMRWLYSRTFFVIWLALIATAGFVVVREWSALLEPLQGLLATRNLAIMWVTLILLKVCHEFGHAYACKHYGGHVPEMGVYLILFTPCAYVDATASWGFTSKWHRLAVSLAGMYVESAIAAIAVLVWALTGPSLLHAVAYNVIFMASVVTVLFNINPLMRYDGYYIASDLLEIPNLRQRSTQHALRVLRRIFLGLRETPPPMPARLKCTLLSFGLAASAYRTIVIVGIATVVAMKFALVGLALGAAFVGMTAVGIVRRLVGYLWFAEQTAPVRVRAVALSLVLLAALPAGVALLPVPREVCAAAAVAATVETPVRVSTPGFVEQVDFAPGQVVRAGQRLVRLAEPSADERTEQVEALLHASRIREQAYAADDPTAARQEAAKQRYLQRELAEAARQRSELDLRAPIAGRVVRGLRAGDRGRYLGEGEEAALLIEGPWEVQAVLTAEEFASVSPRVGQRVAFRSSAKPDDTCEGVVRRILPAATRELEQVALTQAAGGGIVVAPETGETQHPYFHVFVELEEASEAAIAHGVTGVVRLPAAAEPLGLRLYRQLANFTNTLARTNE